MRLNLTFIYLFLKNNPIGFASFNETGVNWGFKNSLLYGGKWWGIKLKIYVYYKIKDNQISLSFAVDKKSSKCLTPN